jgi:hypothetical protein
MEVYDNKRYHQVIGEEKESIDSDTMLQMVA